MATSDYKYKIKWVPPYSSFSDIENPNIKKQNIMQSYTQFVEYFFPNIDFQIVKNTEHSDICIVDIKHTDSAALKDDEINILVSTENILNKNFFWYSHYNKYSEYGDNKIKIYIYSHISKLIKTKNYLAIPCIYTRIHYFLNNYERLYNEPTLNIPFQNKLFCLVIKMNFNNKIKDFINKLNNVGKVDDINIYNSIVMNNSCYNSIELLQILNKYKFVVCVENSNETGYVTEKIFNSFFAKSIPIYSGAPNIYSYFKKDVFINLDNIGNEDELNDTLDFIKKLSEDESLYNSWIERNKICDDYNDENYKYELNYALELCIENKKNVVNLSMLKEKRYTPEQNIKYRTNMRLDYQTDFINLHLKSSKVSIHSDDIEFIKNNKTRYEIDSIDQTIDNNRNIKNLYDYMISLFNKERHNHIYSNYVKEIFKNYNDDIKINSYLMLLCKSRYFFEIMNCVDILKKNFNENEKYIFTTSLLKHKLTKEQEDELRIRKETEEKMSDELRIQREMNEEELRIQREKEEEIIKKRNELTKRLNDLFDHLSYFLENERNNTVYMNYLKGIFKNKEKKMDMYLKLLKPCKNYNLIADSVEKIIAYRHELEEFELSLKFENERT